ncbi:MAG: T9SS type A sorting domain-containing protein [Muribaculaceae bacterium]|nr:T9SS type A sorting domain-containing protein [Muribaculaceae bacterium]
MKRTVMILLTMIALAVSNMASAQLSWRETNREVTGRSLTDPKLTDGIEIYGNAGVITIKTPRRITVRVFTILGQSVSQAVLNPGTSELRIGTRGIYIVKIGNLTQKVAL